MATTSMNGIVARRYGDSLPSNGIFFLVHGGCHLCIDGHHGCMDLVCDPVGTLLDRERWPDHWNNNVMRGLVERWARSVYALGTLDGVPAKTAANDFAGLNPLDPDLLPTGGELALWGWLNMWPIPLGHGALARSIDAGLFPPQSEPRRLFNLMPFGGDEYGALILFGNTGEAVVEFFGLADPNLDAAGHTTGFQGGGAEFRITGCNPAEPNLRRFVDNARRWWATFAGQSVPAGRPAGTKHDCEWYRSRAADYLREHGRVPKECEFLRFAGVPRTTMRENLEPCGLWPWKQFVRDAFPLASVRR